MRIHDLGRGTASGWVEVSATVTWEDADRPSRRIVFATPAEHAAALAPNPNAFLLAAIMPALHRAERRVQVEGSLCPQLRDGLGGALRRLQRWQGAAGSPVPAIEATQGFAPAAVHRPSQTASFLSGGVDSLATLCCNRRDFPGGHPGAITTCVVVQGFESGGQHGRNGSAGRFERLRETLGEVATAAGATLLPVTTNLRALEDPGIFFRIESCGAALAAVAHACAPRPSDVLVAASASLSDPGPIGTHPLLDPSYASTADLRLREHGAGLERLEKVALVARWEEARQRLRVCNDPLFDVADPPNCGRCEKCVLTMLELLAIGMLAGCRAFPADDVPAARIAELAPPFPPRAVAPADAFRADAFAIGGASAHAWHELRAPLARLGRSDLVRAIDDKLARCARLARPRVSRVRRAVRALVRRVAPAPGPGQGRR